MIRRPPRSTQSRSSAASDVYKRQSQAQVTSWLNTDVSMAYTYDNNDQVYKGDFGPLIGLLLWPQNDDAKNYLTPAGTRRVLTTQTASTEQDNPYFNIAK